VSKIGKTMPQAITVPGLRERKALGQRAVMLTAYDYPSGRMAEDAGADILLVGDSLGMVIQGHPDTLAVTLDQMVYHCTMVSRAAKRALVVADMPFMTYHTGWQEAVRNCGRCVQEGGVQGVKIEGGAKRADLIKALVDNEIPVMGHIGLTPQSLHAMGGFKVQGRTLESAERLLEDAKAVEAAGAFCMVLECIPSEVAREITARSGILTIGIGAGPHCDGQVLVFHDVLGLYDGPLPRFVRPYGDFGKQMREALGRFREDVMEGRFPTEEEAFHLAPELEKRFGEKGPDPAREAGTSGREP
jgi:3-methyl-2-oxobutanoate hydroxymethyltransferase